MREHATNAHRDPRGAKIQLTIPVHGADIAASLYEGAASTFDTEVTAVIASATGVRRSYYDGFARHLAANGVTTVTFDYRGIGDSRRAEIRDEPARMTDWAEKDLDGAIRWARARSPRGRIVLVGHSFGGQAAGLAPSNGELSGVLGVGAQLGDYRLWPAPRRYGYALLWHSVVPATTRVFGYLPGSFGIGQDLPAGVAQQWARWCRQPGYFFHSGHGERERAFARVTGHVLAYGFDDDAFAPPRAVSALLANFTHAHRYRVHRTRREMGRAVGHFGFFRRAFASTLWAEATRWISGFGYADAPGPAPHDALAVERWVPEPSWFFDRFSRSGDRRA